jgi:hypothetical protein
VDKKCSVLIALFSNLTGQNTCDCVTAVIFSRISRLFEITNSVNPLGTDSMLNSLYE